MTATVGYNGRLYRFRGPTSDHIYRQLGSGAFYELDLLEAIRAERRMGVYVDVGACLGSHAVYFACECPSTTVLAIEPNPFAYQYLAANTRHVPNIARVRAAVHDTWDTCHLVPPSTNGNIGMSRIGAGGPTQCIKLDDLVNYAPAVIKIDVEGAELPVLRSGAILLAAHKPLLAVECHDGEALAAVEALIGPFGYRRKGRYAKTPTYLFA